MAVAAGMRAYQLGWDHALSGGGSITYEEGACPARGSRRQGVQGGGADPTSALVVGTAMLLGLVARQRTGASQFLQSTMLNSSAYLVSEAFFTYGGTTVDPTHDENGLPRPLPAVPDQRRLGLPRRPIPIGMGRPERRVGRGDRERWGLTDDPRFATPVDRAANDGLLAEALGGVLASLPAAEWEQQLLARGVTCVEVSEVPLSQFDISSPTAVDNGFVAEVDHHVFGRYVRHGPMVTLSATPGQAGPAAMVGQHTRSILAELGYSDAEVAQLRAEGIVGWPER